MGHEPLVGPDRYSLSPLPSQVSGMTLLQHAAYYGQVPIATYLLDQGADINCTPLQHNGEPTPTALYLASIRGEGMPRPPICPCLPSCSVHARPSLLLLLLASHRNNRRLPNLLLIYYFGEERARNSRSVTPTARDSMDFATCLES